MNKLVPIPVNGAYVAIMALVALTTAFQMSGAQGATMMHGIKNCFIIGTNVVLGRFLTGNQLFETALV